MHSYGNFNSRCMIKKILVSENAARIYEKPFTFTLRCLAQVLQEVLALQREDHGSNPWKGLSGCSLYVLLIHMCSHDVHVRSTGHSTTSYRE